MQGNKRYIYRVSIVKLRTVIVLLTPYLRMEMGTNTIITDILWIKIG